MIFESKEMLSENTWMVHCMSLATIGMLGYMQISDVIAAL